MATVSSIIKLIFKIITVKTAFTVSLVMLTWLTNGESFINKLISHRYPTSI